MSRPRLSSQAELAVHAEKLETLEENDKQHDVALGALLREVSEMRTDMAERLATICTKLDKVPSSAPSRNGSGDNIKLGALIACITALAQVVVELAKAVIAAH